jgi:hypothetical protein
VIGPSKGRYPHRTTWTQNKRRHPWLEWDSKPTIPVFERARSFHALDREATVIGLAPTYEENRRKWGRTSLLRAPSSSERMNTSNQCRMTLKEVSTQSFQTFSESALTPNENYVYDEFIYRIFCCQHTRTSVTTHDLYNTKFRNSMDRGHGTRGLFHRSNKLLTKLKLGKSIRLRSHINWKRFYVRCRPIRDWTALSHSCRLEPTEDTFG